MNRLIITGTNSEMPRNAAQMAATRIRNHNRVESFNAIAAERQLSDWLDGKFFDLHGRDLNEVTEQQEEEEQVAEDREAAVIESSVKVKQLLGCSHIVQAIMTSVAAIHGVLIKDLTSPSRTVKNVAARMHAISLVREKTNRSNTWIGHKFGGRDHATIIHAVNTWAHRKSRYQAQVEAVERQLEAATTHTNSPMPGDSGAAAELRHT